MILAIKRISLLDLTFRPDKLRLPNYKCNIMKNLLLGALLLGLFTSCKDNDNISFTQNDDLHEKSKSHSFKRTCPSEELRQAALRSNPALMQKYELLEMQTKQFANNMSLGKVLSDGTIEIPVVVNIIYNSETGDISNTRIEQQINILNADFAGTNSDASNIPSEFDAVKAGNTKIKFKLADVKRKNSSQSSWGTNDDMKKSSTDGIDATDPNSYLNIWVVGEISGGILGYATFPESAGQWNDGVVISSMCFGKTGASAPFNLGRTTTHEVGHYLNLRHIWGDANCGNDQVSDTPTQPSPNYGTPSYPLMASCDGDDTSVMFMNFMDYVDDSSMYMFTKGQKTRAQAVVAADGIRAGLRN
ncbi:hypothetical protein CHRY9293_01818 [Chryseobacterium potabilaquae]|uniref:Peptidase M43 pregnancy-associated plasma-A domain-containing protein n=2 Tax=Chryseobacterium potabilaquae TaxID=2675057 RepID=A0A6N4X846_9FLAO|nr:hypothetical protein CHRY9293_01818 [Chryseobacterium potabilaquae]